MRINNNFNVLPFYDSLQKLNSNKWYTFGQHYPLICPNNALLPFQFVVDTNITLSNIEAVNLDSGEVTDLGVKPEIQLGSQTEASYYVVKMPETTIKKMTDGLHYLRINTSKGYIYSEEFIFTDNISEYIKLEYWNEDNLNFNGGEINFEDGFKFNLYIQSTIGKPEYEFEEELTKRLGYKFIESQTSNKIYKFNFLAPEYICDAMRLVRLCDYIKLTTKFDSYNALTLSYEPKWKENGDLAAVDVEFETDCIIQKLESFNRRLKESFYNALLANESEPILLDPQTVAQYYTEYTATAYVNGRLIRQLESIGDEEIQSNIGSLVIPIDNQSDETRKAKKIFLSDMYKYMSNVNSLFKGHYDENGNLKWIEALAHLGVNGGVTSYINNGTLNLPSLYAGLPIDNNTLYWEETTNDDGSITKVLKAKGGNGGGGVADSVNWDDIEGKPDLSQYVTSDELDDTLEGYLPLTGGTLTGDLNIESKGELWVKGDSYFGSSGLCVIREDSTNKRMVMSSVHGFNITNNNLYYLNYTGGGIRVNEGLITYNKKDGYWKMEGNLLVTGGITSYSSDGKASPFLIDVDDWKDILSESTTQVYTANTVSLLKTQLEATGSNTTTALNKIGALKTSLNGLSASNVSELVTSLKNIATKL